MKSSACAAVFAALVGCSAPREVATTAPEAESLSITRWSERYELFVELPPPSPGHPIPFHAHVTRLSDFGAVTSGTFRVRFQGAESKEAEQAGVKRPGIFVFEMAAPAAGTYQAQMSYELDGVVDSFDCGAITVSSTPLEATEAPGGLITFLKESQWKIPFGTEWVEERLLAKEMELAAIVEPASVDQLTVGAPTGGRFFHNPRLALGEGLRIKKGEVIGVIAPNVAGDDFSRLKQAVDEASLSISQIQRELERVTPLVQQGLLPERRRLELSNSLEREITRQRVALARMSGVTTPGQEDGLSVRSTLEGVLTEVLVANGAPVEAGRALVRISGSDRLWVRARFVAKPPAELLAARPVALRLPSGERLELDPKTARFLSPQPVVDPASRVATWIVDLGELPKGALVPGTTVVLLVRLGEPERVLAVRRGAIVEINTRPYAFVQADGEHFQKRAVTLGRVDGPWVQVSSGLSRGERVVDRGGYDIHLASLLGTIESHRH